MLNVEQVGNGKLGASGMNDFVDILSNNVWVHDAFIST